MHIHAMETSIYGRMYIQFIVAVRDTRALLPTDAQSTVRERFTRFAARQGVAVLAFGFRPDHLHALIEVPHDLVLVSFIQAARSEISRFLRRQRPTEPAVRWQRNVVILSYSHSHLPAVIEFIHGQAEYHRRHSFREELDFILARTQPDTAKKPFEYILTEGNERLEACFPDAIQ